MPSPAKPGQERELEIELRPLADVGIIGLPNAGKSTLIATISAVRPKIADSSRSPTLVPNLGVVRLRRRKRFCRCGHPRSHRRCVTKGHGSRGKFCVT